MLTGCPGPPRPAAMARARVPICFPPPPHPYVPTHKRYSFQFSHVTGKSQKLCGHSHNDPFQLQSVTSHPTKVFDLRLSKLHSACCSHSEETLLEEEELESKHELQMATDTNQNIGVMIALALLSFYRREISPFLPQSCRFVPSCSEYSMQAYQRYGVIKGTILTAWRLIRCNPFEFPNDDGSSPLSRMQEKMRGNAN